MSKDNTYLWLLAKINIGKKTVTHVSEWMQEKTGLGTGTGIEELRSYRGNLSINYYISVIHGTNFQVNSCLQLCRVNLTLHLLYVILYLVST